MIGSTEKSLAIENAVRGAIFLGVIGGLIVACGGLLGGHIGLLLGLALGMTFVAGTWSFSDRLVIRASGARCVDGQPTELDTMLTELSFRAAIPTPRCYVTPSPQPNAFAIGRTPRHAAIVVTEGLLSLLDPAEIRAVLAHELMHIRRRDTLMTAMAGAALSEVFAVVELTRHFPPLRRRRHKEGPGIALASCTQLVIGLVRHARRSCRESDADRDGSDLAGDPEALARALWRIDRYTQVVPMEMPLAHVSNWVVNPLGDRDGKAWLFSTVPPLTDRIDRLRGAKSERMAT